MPDDRWARVDARRAKADGPFQQLCSGFLHLSGWSTGRTAKRLDKALWALREFRDAHGQERNMGSGELILAVRVVADELAGQIQEAAGDPVHGADPATIAWVLAGMRCPSKPFCTGCTACFTITAPNRIIPAR
jgi:hypothetical protein